MSRCCHDLYDVLLGSGDDEQTRPSISPRHLILCRLFADAINILIVRLVVSLWSGSMNWVLQSSVIPQMQNPIAASHPKLVNSIAHLAWSNRSMLHLVSTVFIHIFHFCDCDSAEMGQARGRLSCESSSPSESDFLSMSAIKEASQLSEYSDSRKVQARPPLDGWTSITFLRCVGKGEAMRAPTFFSVRLCRSRIIYDKLANPNWEIVSSALRVASGARRVVRRLAGLSKIESIRCNISLSSCRELVEGSAQMQVDACHTMLENSNWRGNWKFSELRLNKCAEYEEVFFKIL